MLTHILNQVLRIRRLYWWLIRPKTEGVRALVINSASQVLLVQHRYGEGWMLPGGRIRRSETAEAALRRELKEEVGVVTDAVSRTLGTYHSTFEYKRDTITVFVVTSFNQGEKRHFEIKRAQFYDARVLPEGTTPSTRRRIEEWLGQRPIGPAW